MSSTGEERSFQVPSLTALPRVEELPRVENGYDPERVHEAFEAFRRHAAQVQAQLRVLQAAGRGGTVEASGHAVRMDALHLIRAAAEFADTFERDAQTASAAQVARTQDEVRQKQDQLREREAEIERFRVQTERERAEARKEARDILAKANLDASQEIREAEARGARLLEQARHQATELTNAARAEVEQTLDWARGQAGAVMARAQSGVEQLLRAAGLGENAISEVAQTIVAAAQATIDSRAPGAVVPAVADAPEPEQPEARLEEAPPAAEPAPAAEPEAEPAEDDGTPDPAS
jgi:hypothetical protein